MLIPLALVATVFFQFLWRFLTKFTAQLVPNTLDKNTRKRHARRLLELTIFMLDAATVCMHERTYWTAMIRSLAVLLLRQRCF